MTGDAPRPGHAGAKIQIGVVACTTMRREIDQLIAGDPDVAEVVILGSELHVDPVRMRATVVERVEAMARRVDVVFLGYGTCRSLRGIEADVSVPVVLPQFDDCLAILLTPQRYAEERAAEAGTWFMTPGWAEVGADMLIRELHLDHGGAGGPDPMELARRLFTHYRRGLYVDTGVGDDEELRAKARAFCDDFSLRYEETAATSPILLEALARAKDLARAVAR